MMTTLYLVHYSYTHTSGRDIGEADYTVNIHIPFADGKS